MKKEKHTVQGENKALVGDRKLERVEEGGGLVEHCPVGCVDSAHRICLLPFSLSVSNSRSIEGKDLGVHINKLK
jgi:hypothetical protein